MLSLLDTSDSISFITSFRLNKFIKELKTDDGEAYASYDPHNSPISSLELLITKAPNGKSILYITPGLTNTKDYEARIIKLLNKPPLKGNLEPHFTNRNYERIQQSADIKISGTERELDKISEVLQTSMGFEYVTLSSIEGYWKSQSRKFTLPANTVQEKKLLAPYEVKIYISDFYYSRREIGISFRHPEAQELMYYQGRYLNNARNTFRRSLEASLSK